MTRAPHEHEILAHYFAQLRAASASLSEPARAELIADIETHIDDARSEVADETDAELLNLIQRVGNPDDIVANASAPHPAGYLPVVFINRLFWTIQHRRSEAFTVLLATAVWPAAVLLAFVSTHWTRRDKAVALLIPCGLYGLMFVDLLSPRYLPSKPFLLLELWLGAPRIVGTGLVQLGIALWLLLRLVSQTGLRREE